MPALIQRRDITAEKEEDYVDESIWNPGTLVFILVSIAFNDY